MIILDELLSIQRTRSYYDDNDIDIEKFNSNYDIIDGIIKRYFNLQDRYLNQNEKHFRELCSNYFDDFPVTVQQEGNAE